MLWTLLVRLRTFRANMFSSTLFLPSRELNAAHGCQCGLPALPVARFLRKFSLPPMFVLGALVLARPSLFPSSAVLCLFEMCRGESVNAFRSVLEMGNGF